MLFSAAFTILFSISLFHNLIGFIMRNKWLLYLLGAAIITVYITIIYFTFRKAIDSILISIYLCIFITLPLYYYLGKLTDSIALRET